MNRELVKLGERTYVILNPVNIGIYVLNDNNVCIIDTGSSKDYAKMIDKILIENNWHLKFIINTHSHADHISGNKYLQDKYNCQIYASKVESYFINTPYLEPSLMYGASAIKGLYSHVLYAKESACEDIELLNNNDLQIINLEGHSTGLIGIVTSDKVCFVGDAYTSVEKIAKYAIQYTYDIDKYVESLERLLNTDYLYYVPSHGNIEKKKDAFNTIIKNKETSSKVKEMIYNLVKDGITYSDLVHKVFSEFNINMNVVQYYVIKATLKAYITSLEKDNRVEIIFDNNNMIIKAI